MVVGRRGGTCQGCSLPAPLGASTLPSCYPFLQLLSGALIPLIPGFRLKTGIGSSCVHELPGGIWDVGGPEGCAVLGSFWERLAWGALGKKAATKQLLSNFETLREGDLNTARRLCPHEGKQTRFSMCFGPKSSEHPAQTPFAGEGRLLRRWFDFRGVCTRMRNISHY